MPMRDPSGEAPLGPDPAAKERNSRSIKSLRLDVQAALDGRTWLLLPEGFRDTCGNTYPLPTRQEDLAKLAAIPIPPAKKDSGCVYLRRAVALYKERMSKRQSATLDLERTRGALRHAKTDISNEVKDLRAEAQKALDEVRAAAQEAVASLKDLFALGRKGMNEIMDGYLNDREVHGERIGHQAFMGCFRMVSQTVKAMGLPSEQRDKASEAIMDQLAESLANTKDAVAQGPHATLAPGTDEGTPQ